MSSGIVFKRKQVLQWGEQSARQVHVKKKGYNIIPPLPKG
jgi:hypothetical protein